MLLLLACQPATPVEPVCDFTPSLSRTDPLAGHRELPVSVTADWLDGQREVPMHLWYPTDATEGDAAVYIDTLVDERSLVDAPFLDPGCPAPLVVYSHGSQAWAGNNSPVLRHLVAHGWVAAAPDHVENTLIDNVEPRRIAYSLTRVADVLAVVDALEGLPEDDPLHGRVDTSKILVLGHSYGGQTSWFLSGPSFDLTTIEARCATDALGCTEAELAAFADWQGEPRVASVLPLDGSASLDWVSEEGWADAEVPIVYLSQADDADAQARAAAADVTWASFEGACHETFTNSPVTCSTFDKEEGLDLTAAWLAATAGVHLLGLGGDHAAVLDGTLSLDPRVTVTHTR